MIKIDELPIHPKEHPAALAGLCTIKITTQRKQQMHLNTKPMRFFPPREA